MIATDSADLFDVVASVHEMKSRPLVRTERAQNHMARKGAVPKQGSSCLDPGFKVRQRIVDATDQAGSIQQDIGQRRADRSRSVDPRRKEAQPDQKKLAEVLPNRELRLRWTLFLDTPIEQLDRAAVAHHQMLNDLLDAPLAGMLNRSELALRGVERAQCRSQLGFQPYQVLLHGE